MCKMRNNTRFSRKLNDYFKDRDNIKLTFVYEIGFDRIVIIVTQNDKVYQFERDLSAELGLGDDCNIIESAIVDKLCGKQIIDFANANNYTLARTRDGKVYIWLNSRKENSEHPNKTEPHLFQFFQYQKLVIKDIKCGDYYSLALTQTGDVYIWGFDIYLSYPTTPFKLNSNSKIIDMISCGARYFLVIARHPIQEIRQAFYWRVHEFGKQFNVDRIKLNAPNSVGLPGVGAQLKKISCGKNHSLLLTVDGNLFAYGCNYWGQVGKDSNFQHIKSPIAVDFPEKIQDIATHYEHNISAALSENGNFYVWGKCGEEVHKIPKKLESTSFKEIFAENCRITCGTVEGNLVIDDTFIYNGRYEKRFTDFEFIANGSFGHVYKVQAKYGGKNFAVKKIEVKNNRNSGKDLLKEFKFSSNCLFTKLDKKYFVHYYDAWFENDFDEENGLKIYKSSISLFIQMELCITTLGHIINEIQKSSSLKMNGLLTFVSYYFASQLFIEILESVDFLHTLNPPIMHRDLKPDNILLTHKIKNRFVRIADFGLIAVHKYANQLHTKDIGDLNYQAPEVGDGEYDTKADVYSLGIILKALFSIDSRSIFPELEGNLESEILPKIRNPILKTKYDFLIKLSKRMTNVDKTERPDCREILNQRVLWALNRNEINEEIKIDCNGEDSKVNDFIYSIIVSKYKS